MCADLFMHWFATGAITGEAVFVYILFCAFKVFMTTEGPADCEILSVIHFLNPRNVKPYEIHRQISEVNGENAMSDGMVRKWVRKSNKE